MKPTPVTTQMRINREAAEDILVNITANFTPAAGKDPGDEALVEKGTLKAGATLNFARARLPTI